jgi:superfamily I DNA and/or RNA helicase
MVSFKHSCVTNYQSLYNSNKSVRTIDLFVDEAAAATEAEMIIPFHLRPNRLLMVGDPKQLPATIMSPKASKFGLERSLLDRLMNDFNDDHIMLDVQYRMKPCISAFPNTAFYNEMLQNSTKVCHRLYHGKIELEGKSSYAFVNVIGEEQRNSNGSYYNISEATAIVNILKQIKGVNRFGNDIIRIITFYQGQVS